MRKAIIVVGEEFLISLYIVISVFKGMIRVVAEVVEYKVHFPNSRRIGST